MKVKNVSVHQTKYNPSDLKDVVPQGLQDMFAIVQQLGRFTFDQNKYTADNKTPYKPWELDNMKKALQLVDIAAKCRVEGHVEYGWRMNVESKLFERFDIEVAWQEKVLNLNILCLANCCSKLCRKRLWRSEVEASPISNSTASKSLQERQAKRKPCRCNPSDRPYDRISETICDPAPAEDQSYNSKQQPDRVQGLRRTKNFESVLRKPYAHDCPQKVPPRLVEQVVETSLQPKTVAEPILFPFLLLEAKREKDSEGFHSMEVQTALPICHALHLQHELLQTAGVTLDLPGGPLVWFFAYSGEDWRVYAGFAEKSDAQDNVAADEDPVTKYVIVRLWSGCITGRDEAYQLVLILDYILDWARDIYRPNILSVLCRLSTQNFDDTMTSRGDSDIQSLQGDLPEWLNEQQENQATTTNINTESIIIEKKPPDILSLLDGHHGQLRDARFIETRLRALYITSDNIGTLFQGFEHQNLTVPFAKSILRNLMQRCVVLESEAVLNAIEGRWTGNRRPDNTRPQNMSRVYAHFRISYFVNHSWEQVRQLTYLAISEDARQFLINHTQYQKAAKSFAPPKCDLKDLMQKMDDILQRSVRRDFISALMGRNFSVHMEKTWVVQSRDYGCSRDVWLSRLFCKLDMDKESPGLAMDRIVHRIYNQYRNGLREPSEPFLRLSSRIDSEGRPLWRGWGKGSQAQDSWDQKHYDKILVYGSLPKASIQLAQTSQPNFWLFVLDGQFSQLNHQSIADKLLHYLLVDCIYGTVRKLETTAKGRLRSNSQKVYYFTLDDAKTHLGVPRERLKRQISEWIAWIK